MRALLAAGLQQQFGDGRVVGHDGDVEWRQTLAVGRVQVQLLGRELVEENLHSVQVLLLHGLQETLAALHGLQTQSHDLNMMPSLAFKHRTTWNWSSLVKTC